MGDVRWGRVSGADFKLNLHLLVAVHVGEDSHDQVEADIEEGQETSHEVIVDRQEVLWPEAVENLDELPNVEFNKDKVEEGSTGENDDVTSRFRERSDEQHHDRGNPDGEAPNDTDNARVRQQLVGQESSPLLRRYIIDFVSDDGAEEGWSDERQHDTGDEVTDHAHVPVPVPREEVSGVVHHLKVNGSTSLAKFQKQWRSYCEAVSIIVSSHNPSPLIVLC